MDGPSSSSQGAPFVMPPPEMSLFCDASLHGWDAHLGTVVSTGEEFSHQSSGDYGCFLGSSVLAAGVVGHSSGSHVGQFDRGGLFTKLGGALGLSF